MAYTDETKVRNSSPFKDSSKVTTTVVTNAITEADGLINSRVGGVYVVPFATTPALIQGIATDIAVYNLVRDENLNLEIAQGVNLQAMLQDALSLLDDIASRRLRLFDSDGDEYPLRNQNNVSFYPNNADTEDGDAPRQFTMDQKF